MTRAITLTLVIVSIAAAAIYLHDPPWVGDLTYGFQPWNKDAPASAFADEGPRQFFRPERCHRDNPEVPVAQAVPAQSDQGM
jgi:hypothetical protein